MSADVRGRSAAWRPARECALGLCVAWLVVQNLALVIALLVGGPAAAWHTLAPVIGAAFLLMTPLWLVPAALLVAGRMSGHRAECPGTREVSQ
jgi:hypothetical protein